MNRADYFDEEDDELPSAAELQAIEMEGDANGSQEIENDVYALRNEAGKVLSIPIVRPRKAEKPTAWTGSDQSRLRTELNGMLRRNVRTIAVDLTNVIMANEGTFGELGKFTDKPNTTLYLLNPGEEVKHWHWFEMFTTKCGDGLYQMHKDAKREFVGRPEIFRAYPTDDEDNTGMPATRRQVQRRSAGETRAVYSRHD
ncbi:hypothetical protein FJZ27_00270 [Candidatus Peribacteria bacterium]|nr:hypothetical protein [Candidatus Peribacteria bacterium]